MIRSLLAAALLSALTVLGTGCAAPDVADYAAEKPVLDLREYFNGTVNAWGVFTDRSGKVVNVDFDDWMYLMSDHVMLNRAAMSKFGFGLEEVTLSFTKQ